MPWIREFFVYGFAFLAVGIAAFAGPLWAQSNNQNPWADGSYQAQPLPEIDGAVSWDTLADVELVFEDIDLVPDFGPGIEALEGETVTMVGFVMPIDSSGMRQLLTVNSPHCPFCIPGGPETFVELVCEEPMDLVMDPVVVEGRFELIRAEWDGYFYRMTEVEVIDQ